MNEFQQRFFDRYIKKCEAKEEIKGMIRETVSEEVNNRIRLDRFVGKKTKYVQKVAEEVGEVLTMINDWIDDYKLDLEIMDR